MLTNFPIFSYIFLLQKSIFASSFLYLTAESLNSIEKRATASLAFVFVLRMLGLFMLMPVLALYAQHLEHYSYIWVGIAIGAYGCTQALFQIPAGWLSDRFGRKPIIIIGLVIFALGSLIAANATSLYWVAIGRGIQGMGAIAAAVLALAADLSRESQRTKVMAVIGISIGMSFALAMVLGPVLAGQFGLSGLFYIIAAMAFVAIVIVQWGVPNPVNINNHNPKVVKISGVKKVLADNRLIKLDYGVFIIHWIMTATFIALPLQLLEHQVMKDQHWAFYLPVFILSFVVLGPLMKINRKAPRRANSIAISLLILGISMLALNFDSLWLLGIGAWMYFSGFNFLEASMPSLLTKLAPEQYKGSATGVYSTSQFLGAFMGGVAGGMVMQSYGAFALYCLSILLLISLLVCWRKLIANDKAVAA